MSAGASEEFCRQIRLAISDPGAIVDRRDRYQEELLSWQGRAVMRVIYSEQRADLEQARRIAVALEQENARLRELTETLATRWADWGSNLQILAAIADPDDLVGNIRCERARILHMAAADVRWILAHDSIPHDLMTDAELGPEPTDGAP